MKEFLSFLFDSLNKKEIVYAVMRNYEHLPEYVGNDVDIWIRDGDQLRVQEILVETSQKCGWDVVKISPKFGFKCDYFFAKKSLNIHMLHIDCWWFFYWRNIAFIDQGVFSEHLVFSRNCFFIPSPGVEASILLLQNLLYHGKVKEKYKSRIVDFSNKDHEVFLDAIRKPFGEKVAKSILELANKGEWDELERNYKFLRQTLFKRALFQKTFFQFKQWVIYFYEQLKIFLFPHSGIFIVFIGPDGSGKSTTAKALLEGELAKKTFQKKYYFHGHFPYLPELKRIVTFFRGDKNIALASENVDSSKPVGVLQSMVYPVYYGFNYFFGHFFIWKEKARGGLIVFDRYFYDYYIQRTFNNCPRWLLNVIARVIPKPDIILYLKNDPQVIYRRKPELTLEEIARQSNICESIVKKYNGISFVVETTTSEETIRDIQGIILNKMIEKQKVRS
jgi:thymidylate kinase